MGAVAASNIERPVPVRGFESSREHQNVERMLGAAPHPHALRSDSFDRSGFERDIRALEGRVIVVGEEHALASDGIVGCQLASELGVFYLRFEVNDGLARKGRAALRRPTE